MSVNAERYERFCFERWFLIHAYVEISGREPVYLDSDCLPLPGFAMDNLPQDPMLDGTFHCRRTDGTLQRFYTLHFQGDSKRLAPLFLRRSTMNAPFGRATLKSLYRDRYGCDPASAPSSQLH